MAQQALDASHDELLLDELTQLRLAGSVPSRQTVVGRVGHALHPRRVTMGLTATQHMGYVWRP